jgi:hypothetical protein
MADSYFIMATLYLIAFLIFAFPFSYYVMWIVGGITLIGLLASYLLAEAMVHGVAGPGYALHEVSSPVTLLLEIFFL